MAQNFVQIVRFQYIKELVGLLGLRAYKICFRDYERAMQDMKNRQITENCETTMYCEAGLLRLLYTI